MSDATAGPWELPEAIHPPPVSLRGAWPWLLFALALLAVIYIVGMDEGALSAIPGMRVHEMVHDGRHLLGFPCH
jgi:Probable cobalt transporter subunit (CbtB)